MKSKVKLVFFNHSEVFGGQESYLIKLFSKLEPSFIPHSFIGSPLKEFDDYRESTGIIINVLNGNKALYKYCMKYNLNNKTNTIYIQHSSLDDSQGPLYKRLIRKILIYFCLKRMDAVIRVCDKCLPEKYAQGKVTTVHNGVELKTLTPKTPNSTFNLLMVGAVNDNKNQKLAIEALVKLQNTRLSIVGTGPDVTSLTQLAKELGVGERVNWLGFQDDPEPYYQQADLLLMLSKNEAFPFVILEAMSYGLPVVSVSVGGVPEAVTHLENGWLLDSYQPESLVEAVQSIQHNSALYLKLSKNGISTIQNKFSIENMTQGFLSVVQAVLDKRGNK